MSSLGKFAYRGTPEREWDGLTRTVSGVRMEVRATCTGCGAVETLDTAKAMPPEIFVRKFAQKGWWLGRKPTCPNCHTKVKTPEETPVNAKLSLVPDTTTPTDAAMEQRRMVIYAIEECYDAKAKAYKPGKSDDTVAKEVGCAVNLVATIRDQFFGPAGSMMPPEAVALRAEMDKLVRDGNALNDRAIALSEEAAALYTRADDLQAKFIDMANKLGWRR